MTIKDTTLASTANYTYNLKSGDLYFFDDFIISEIYEGVVVQKEDLIEVINLIHKHFGFEKPYGLISHRPYSYAINLSDIIPIIGEFGLIIANAVVAYNNFSLKNFELEKRVLKLKGEAFTSIEEAVHWTNRVIKSSVLVR